MIELTLPVTGSGRASTVKGRSDGELTPCKKKKKERGLKAQNVQNVSLGGSYTTAANL